tara:strand:+ start:2393 stop:3892 length:1500 start_codon:yes stop_codon:yes gene_type:complete
MPPIIELKKVNFWYDKGKPAEVWALQNVSMEVNQGEYVAFFGPSGCGKTSLLYAISGIEQPQDGNVLVGGKDISQLSPRDLAIYRQDGIGIVFQRFNLFPSLTVAANVALPMSFLRVRPKERMEKALNLLDRLGIKHLAGRYPHELSGGQQQRVGIARALSNDPPIIVADEPLGNLDSENANKVLVFLKELNEKDKRTVIMVTHEAWSLKDSQRIFFMKDGKVLKSEHAKKSPDSAAQSITQHMLQESTSAVGTTMAAPPSGAEGAGGGPASPEVVAQTLSMLLLRGYSPEEMQRFQKFMEERYKNKLTAQQFRYKLDQPIKEGGVGLWVQKAQHVSEYVERVISERHAVEHLFKHLEKHPRASLKSEVEKIREWLLEEYEGKTTHTQKIHLEKLIENRMRGEITPEIFRERVHAPLKKGGAGISFRGAQHASERLETILQGASLLRSSDDKLRKESNDTPSLKAPKKAEIKSNSKNPDKKPEKKGKGRVSSLIDKYVK